MLATGRMRDQYPVRRPKLWLMAVDLRRMPVPDS
jgi:hypothetical protein